MKIDLKALGRWFVREAVPVGLMFYDVGPDARAFARKNGLPEEAAVALAEQIKANLIGAARGSLARG
jgi:hypothetical protein